jgi:hypothetical protein
MEPSSIRAGDTVSWTRDDPTYPPSAGWTLAYRLIPSAGTPADISTTGSGGTYTATLSATTTAALVAGRCRLVGYVSKAGEYVTVHDDPAFTVLPNLRTAAAADPRSAAEIELEAARTAWNRGVLSYTVGDRQVTYEDSGKLLTRVRYLEQQVSTERYYAAIGAGQEAAPPGRVQYRGVS